MNDGSLSCSCDGKCITLVLLNLLCTLVIHEDILSGHSIIRISDILLNVSGNAYSGRDCVYLSSSNVYIGLILLQLEERKVQLQSSWEDVTRMVRKAEVHKDDLKERSNEELERTGQPLCIYEPYHGKGAWPFLHKENSLYRGLTIVSFSIELNRIESLSIVAKLSCVFAKSPFSTLTTGRVVTRVNFSTLRAGLHYGGEVHRSWEKRAFLNCDWSKMQLLTGGCLH